jgi:hypothetical protein
MKSINSFLISFVHVDGDNLVKMVVLGAPGAGKTSIIQVSQ